MGTTAAARTRTPSSASRTGSRRTVLLGVVPVALAVIGFVVFAATRDSGSASIEPTYVAHVHGLALASDTDEVYAGTHFGLFRFTPDGAAVRRGPVQDLMGFTALDDTHFLASGHPGAGSAGPSSLGVVESTDGGQTWSTIALAGQVDFHTMDASGQRVYGLDVDVLRVSDDGGRTWEQGAPLVATDLAVSPSDPDVVLAATSGGVQRSTDGGRSFAFIASGAPVALVAWPEADQVVAVSEGGNVFTSADGGTSWKRTSELGQPAFALAASSDRIVVATRRGIEESTDGGRTFDIRFPTT